MMDESFNQWRREYRAGTLNFWDHLNYYKVWARVYPSQKCFSTTIVNLIRDYLEFAGFGRQRVIEVGGWRGELAAELINHHGVDTWFNHDFPVFPPAEHVPIHSPKYYYVPLDTWVWAGRSHIRGMNGGRRIAVLSHILEHLVPKHAWELVRWLHGCRMIFTETPVDENGWPDYNGSHVNEMSRRDYHSIFASVGYSPVVEDGNVVVYGLHGNKMPQPQDTPCPPPISLSQELE